MDNRISELLAHPLHKFIGIDDLKTDAGRSTFSVLVHKDIANHANVLHGGVIYLLSDICALVGLFGVLDLNKAAATHNINVSLMRAAKLGAVVKFKSKVARIGSRLAFVNVEVFDEGELVATAQVIKSIFNLDQ